MTRRRAPDTNLVVRLLVDDDPAQTRAAVQFFAMGAAFFSVTVLLETEWVLRANYHRTRAEIAHAIRQLMALPNAATEDEPNLARAVDWYAKGWDFADALHLARLPRDADFVSFDRKLVKRAQRLGLPVLLPG